MPKNNGIATTSSRPDTRATRPVVPESDRKRQYLSQTEVPAFGLEKALRVSQAIADNYGKSPTKPLRVAQALSILPTSSTFRMLTGASIAYGVTEGGYNAEAISITALGRRIVAPTSEGDDLAAKREALLRPRVVKDFLSKYNGSRVPQIQIARNVLEEMGVPADRTDSTFALIMEDAKAVGFLREVKGQQYVDLDSTEIPSVAAEGETVTETSKVGSGTEPSGDEEEPSSHTPVAAPSLNSRVFITHGKNHDIANQLKELLTFGNFQPVISVERETVSKPVPDKVMADMRSCSAAIIHVGTEMKVLDGEGKEQRILNPNVLIEIGAAMALYRRRFILLVEKGVTLPSNLQGLYEVRYDGDKLEYEATMKLLKAFSDFRQ